MYRLGWTGKAGEVVSRKADKKLGTQLRSRNIKITLFISRRDEFTNSEKSF